MSEQRPQSVRRPALYEEVVDHLVRYIADQGLGTGDRLPAERVLAAELGVSRTSVRQALTVLRVSGLIEIRRGLGVYLIRDTEGPLPVIGVDALRADPNLPSVIDVREALESHAAGLAALRRSDTHVAELALANDQMSREIEAGESGLTGDRRFHAALLAAASSPMLLEMLAGIADSSAALARASLARKGQPPHSLATHRLIFGAVVRHDRDEAARLMLDHLQVSRLTHCEPRGTTT